MAKYIYHSEKTKTTCDECLKYDGKIFYNIKNLPKLPIHPNCKCWIETVEDKSDKDKCDCADRLEVLKNNLSNIIENTDTMQKQLKSELLECAIVLENSSYHSYSNSFQSMQEKLLSLQDKINSLIKSTKELIVDIDILKEYSFDSTYHIKSECKMTNGLNKYADLTTKLCEKLNDLSEDIKELKEERKTLSKEAERKAKEEVKELKKGIQTGGAASSIVPIPQDNTKKDNAKAETQYKVKLLGKIPIQEKTKIPQAPKEDFSSDIARFKLHIEHDEFKNPPTTNNTGGASSNNTNSKIKDVGFNSVIGLIHVTEGGFVDDPNDLGGRTNRGITQRTYNAYNKKHGLPIKDVKYITKEEADTIYYKEYWLASGADKIKDPNVAYMHFDSAINHGIGNASVLLKRSGEDFDKYYNARKKFYDDIVKNNPSQKKYYNGWINRINRIKKRKEEITSF